MKTFARLLSVVTFLLSLGFIAQALPTTGALAARDYSAPAPAGYNGNNDKYGNSYESSEYPNSYGGSSPSGKDVDVLALVIGLKGQLDPKVALLAKADTIEVAKVQVDAVVGFIKACAGSLSGVKVDVAAEVQVKIAHLLVNIFVAIISACAAVSVKLGVSVCLTLWAQIDVALHLLLLTLNTCVDGLLKVIVGLCINLDAEILAKLNIIHLDLCVKILALAAKLAALAH